MSFHHWGEGTGMVPFMDPKTLPQRVGVSDCVPLGPGEWKGQSFEKGGKGFFYPFFV